MDSATEKVIHLFTYLKELSKLRTTHIKDVAQYDEVLWFSDIPEESGCQCISWGLWNQGEEEEKKPHNIWIEIRKPYLITPPEVPDDLELWIKDDEVSDSAFDEPGLHDEITIVNDPDPVTSEEETVTLSLNDHPDIFEMWIDYVENKWKPWMEKDRRLQKIQGVYNDLYTIYQKSEKLGEQYEVIVGLGFLMWRSGLSGEIRHPLLTLQARVSFDGVKGIISVSSSVEGPQPKLEIDMLENDDRPSIKDQQAIQEMVYELDGEPWDPIPLEAILKSLANGISTKSRYDRSITRPSHISEVPQIHFSPILILRKRTRRSFVDYYNKILEQLEQGNEVPDNVRGLVELIENEPHVEENNSQTQSPASNIDDSELYFPLPANDEQKQIAQRIEHCRGILVQGPPGTGKSQAITNMVAHLLAKGKRVLVTSETPRALEVLTEMLPEEIRELCVMWLGSGPQAQKSLQQSVLGITQRKVNWDPNRTSRILEKLEKKLGQTRRNQANHRIELTACREADTFQHSNVFNLYSGTLEKIAICINADRDRHGWLLDRPGNDDEPKVVSDELLELLKFDRKLTDNLEREIKMTQVPVDYLISPVQFKELVDSEREAIAFREKAVHNRSYPGFKSLQGLSADVRANLLCKLKSIISRMDMLTKHIHAWVDRAAREIAADQDRVWRHLLELTDQYLLELTKKSREISSLRIIGLRGRDYSEVTLHARSLINHLENSKSLKYLGLFKTRIVKDAWYLIKSVRVEGAPCKTITTLQKLLDWLNCERLLSELDDQWKTYTIPPNGNFATRIAAYEDLCEGNCFKVRWPYFSSMACERRITIFK